MSTIELVKLHGLGNDFLVALDPSAADDAAGELAARGSRLATSAALDPLGRLAAVLCARHTGLGADGLLVARAPATGGDVRMELRNADGREAETSGNGLRCLALALLDEGLVDGPDVAVETRAGLRTVSLVARSAPGAAELTVEMGRLEVTELAAVAAGSPAGEAPGDAPGSAGFERWRAWSVTAGNPHLVLLAPNLDEVDISAIGRLLEPRRAGGQNVEVVSLGPGADELSLLVWERGAGVTLACGTGSTAAAAALRSAGLVGDRVRVHNPGGTVVVALSGADRFAPAARLTGPARRVALVAVDPAHLEGAGGPGATQPASARSSRYASDQAAVVTTS